MCRRCSPSHRSTRPTRPRRCTPSICSPPTTFVGAKRRMHGGRCLPCWRRSPPSGSSSSHVGAALRAPRAVRGSVARHRHRAGMPRRRRPLPGHAEHDARTMGRRRGPLRASVGPGAAHPGTRPRTPNAVLAGPVPAGPWRSRRRPLGARHSSAASCRTRGSSECGASVSRPSSGWHDDGQSRISSSVAAGQPGGPLVCVT